MWVGFASSLNLFDIVFLFRPLFYGIYSHLQSLIMYDKINRIENYVVDQK